MRKEHVKVNNSLILDKDRKYYCNEKEKFKAKISCETESEELFVMEQGKCKVTSLLRGDVNRKKQIPMLCKPSDDGADSVVFEGVKNGTDLKYHTTKAGVKEDIIVNEKADEYSFPFVLKCENVSYRYHEKVKRVSFINKETEEEVFCIPAPFMYDAKGILSKAVDYKVEELGEDEILLTVVADKEWINSEERQLPVVIDPQIVVSGEEDIYTYSWVDGDMQTAIEYTSGGKTYLLHRVGAINDSNEITHVNRMYLDAYMPIIPEYTRVKKVELKIKQLAGTVGDEPAKIGLYQVRDSVDVNVDSPYTSSNLIDYEVIQESTDVNSGVVYTFDITSLYDNISKGEDSYPCFVLKQIDESIVGNMAILYSSEEEGFSPEIHVTYESNFAVNSSYGANSHEIGRFGQGSIDLMYGNLMFDSEDFIWSGNRMPVTIKHLYNSMLRSYKYTKNTGIGLNVADYSAMNVGLGYKLNIMQSMIASTFVHEGVEYNGYIYTDENSNEVFFKISGDTKTVEETGVSYNLYEDVEDKGLVYDPEERTLTMGDEIYLFDESGRLIKVTDGYGNHMDITYTSGKITSVTDGAGRVFNFTYNTSGFLTMITAPDGTTVKYAYTGNYLSEITYADNTKAVIGYSSGQVTSVVLKDASGTNLYKIEYSYSYKESVAKVVEYGVENGEFIAGLTSEYTYSLASRTTTVKTTEAADSEEGETTANVIKTVYTFDEEGNVASQYAYSEDTGNVGTTGTVSGINPISSESGVVSNINNLLVNHNFNGLDSWNNQENNDEALSITNYANGYFTNFGKKLLRMESNNVELVENGVYQITETLPTGEYTLSAYSRIMTAFTGMDKPGAYIRVTDTDNNILSESEHILVRDNEYFRLVAPFEITFNKAVKVHLLVNGSGVAYFDGVQLENNPFANEYNMLENGNFELSDNATWEKTSGVEESTMHFNMSKSIKMTGDVNAERNVHQTVYVKRSRLIRETFTLSGWAKGTSVPKREREGSEDSTFRLRAVIYYSDADYNEYSSETYTADFCPATDGWQFASIEFSKNKFRSVDRIEVYCDYDYNSGLAYFDDIQLVRNSIEKDLSAADFETVDAISYEEDTTEEVEDTAPEFEEKQDAYGNVITDTKFTDGELGTIYRAFGFTPDGTAITNAGNDLIRETDERGNVTSYTVDEETSRNEVVTDRLGNKTAYEYDSAGRTTKVTNKNAAGTEIANVAYSYDSFDNLTEIVRGDGMKYVLAYNAYHNLESIGINGKNEKLVQYTYKNGNGRLKAITYANGDVMKASYNSIGQLIAEKWYDSLETLTAHYKYVYDGQGNIVRSVDVLSNKEYMYIYEGERLVRSVENDVVITNDMVTKRTVAASVHYIYDSEGNITKKRIVTGTDEQVIYLEKAENDSTVVKFTAGGKTITSHSKTDSFGRKVFDELQLGTGFASRQFKYHVGEVTDEHVDNEMLKSTPTTQLVSSISFSDGRIISYEYDAEERITKVIDSIEGTSEYTYDALGQLIKEVYDGDTINEMTYDNYGNILTKNGVAYTYGDTVWKDKLTAVGNETITYDAQGNPIGYLGHTLTWEKGRQLKSFDNYSYTYNANGIRTSKTIDGVKHTYLLDGTKILKETWGENTIIPMYDNEDSVCGIIYNDEPYYFLKNLQGDVVSILDKEAVTVARYIYDAWGECTVTWDDTDCAIADINPFRYRGYYYDEEIEMYYLQSRYYNPRVGRFVNSDDMDYLGLSTTILSYNLYTYCENDGIDFVDYFGHAPSLLTLTLMHNAVVRSAQSFLFSVGIITSSEVRTCNYQGKYNGRMDIYSYIYNIVWEVKRNNAQGINAGFLQLRKYASSYVYSLYHSPFKNKINPEYGDVFVYGAVVVLNYLVTYHSYEGSNSLIVYDYMSLEKAAQLLFNAAMATSAAFALRLAQMTKKTREKIYAIINQIKKIVAKVGKSTTKALKAIANFLKLAGGIILIIVALIIFACTGIPIPA